MVERYDEELFLGYVEGTLSPEQTLRFEKLLVEDARLRNLVAQLVVDRAPRLKGLPKEPAPPELMERANGQLERNMLLGASPIERSAAPVRRLRFKRAAAYAALAAMVLVVATLVIRTLNEPSLNQLASREPAAEIEREDRRAERARQREAADFKEKGDASPPAVAAADPDADAKRSEEDKEALDTATPTERLAFREGPRRDEFPSKGAAPAARPELRTNDALEIPTPPPAAAAEATPSPDFAARDATLFKGAGKDAAAEKPTAEAPGGATGAAAEANREEPPTDAVRSKMAPANASKTGSYATKDVPIPNVAPQGPITETPVQLEITSASADTTERELLTWAIQNSVQVVTPGPDEKKQEAAAAQAPAAGMGAAGGDASARQGEAVQREVVLILAGRQVPQLVHHLNSQKGQMANLTQAIASPRVTLAAREGEQQQQMEIVAGTQPATQPQAGENAAGQPQQVATLAEAVPTTQSEGAGVQANEPAPAREPADATILAAPNAQVRLNVLIQEAPPRTER